MLDEFLKSPAGHAVFGLVIAVAAVVIIELNYRLFFKYVLDFVFALVFTVVCSPAFLVGAIISRKKEGYVFDETPYLGAKGRIIYVKSFAGAGAIKNLPRLLSVLSGKASFVGVSFMTVPDGALLDDEAMDRFGARPGLVNHLVLRGHEGLTYEEVFALDKKYVKSRELFTDIFTVIKYFVLLLRGEGKTYLGEAKDSSYGEALLARGQISKADLDNARKNATDALDEEERRENFKTRGM
jgi:lipopolysaccharide/colanic/teichoic acid biosynthesis glycosyltransferase